MFLDVLAINLPDPRKDYYNVTALVIGWGKNASESNREQRILQKAKVITSHCKNSKYDKKRISENMICAADEANGRDACGGDSGGPLAVEGSGGTYVQIGIVSFGENCSIPGYPGVYTSVTRLLPWINGKKSNFWTLKKVLASVRLVGEHRR